MSHTTEIGEIVFSDIPALQAAVKELKQAGIKCDLVQNTTARAYYQNQKGMDGAHPYVLKLHDCQYDVAFVKDDAKKGMSARTDLWGQHVQRVLGVQPQQGESVGQAALGKLNQLYAVHAATRQAAKQGYQVRRNVKPDGTICLVMQVPN